MVESSARLVPWYGRYCNVVLRKEIPKPLLQLISVLLARTLRLSFHLTETMSSNVMNEISHHVDEIHDRFKIITKIVNCILEVGDLR
jgi:hypothetical protein